MWPVIELSAAAAGATAESPTKLQGKVLSLTRVSFVSQVGAGGADEFQSQIMCRAVDDSLNMGPESSFLPPAAASGNNKDEL
jgi:hypothetical protein